MATESKVTVASTIALARAEVGYTGKKSNKDLDDPTANTVGKYTKYARDLFEAGYYGGKNKNGYDWCCVFVDWLFNAQTGSLAGTEKYKPVSIYGAGVGWAYKAYKSAGMTATDPQPGDQVFYYSGTEGDFTHTGLVVSVESDTIHTIEGNWNNRVTERELPKTDKRIYGYGRPKYDAEEPEEFELGDEVGLKESATRYCSGYTIPDWVKETIPLYVRNVNGAKITISVLAVGDITGTVWAEDLYHLEDGGDGGDDDEPEEDVVKIPREDYNKLKGMAEALVDQAHDLLDKLNDFS